MSPSQTRPYRNAYVKVRRSRIQTKGAGRAKPERCDLCGGPPGGRWHTFHYDHQHGTDRFRGWLCNKCNQALGLAGDNPALLRRMADYLVERGFTVTRSVLR